MVPARAIYGSAATSVLSRGNETVAMLVYAINVAVTVDGMLIK